MSVAGIVNELIHKIQVNESIHLSDASKRDIERDLMKAFQTGGKVSNDEKNYWKNKYLAPEITVNRR